jgi:Tfp pilus assembly protein PilP
MKKLNCPKNRIVICLITACLLFFFVVVSPLAAQEEAQENKAKTKTEQEKKAAVSEDQAETETVIPRKLTIYNPKDSRDPFKDLLGGREPDSKPDADGISALSVEELMLTGIIKVQGELIAIIKDPQGFPAYVKEGDRFVDGYVLSIEPAKVTLRKMTMRGIPLMKPRDIVKELFSEEQ